MRKMRAIAPLVLLFAVFLFFIGVIIVGPVVYHTFVGAQITPVINPQQPPGILPVDNPNPVVIQTPQDTTPETPTGETFEPVATISSVNFCDTPDENGRCASNTQIFASSPKRVDATAPYTNGVVGSIIQIKWYRPDGEHVVEDQTISATDGFIGTSLSSYNDEFPLGSGNYVLKFIQEGTELGSYQFTIA